MDTEARNTRAEAQREYLASVLRNDPQRRKLSQIAKDGGLKHTTLTRFFNNPRDGQTLSDGTIQTIAKVTGVAPPPALIPQFAIDANAIEVAANPFLPEDHPHIRRAVEALIGPRRNHTEAVVLATRAIIDWGYQPGDVLLIDYTAKPMAGDIVMAERCDWNGAPASLLFRLYQPPYLVGSSALPAYRVPHPVDGRTFRIKGVVTEALRQRRHSDT